MLLRQIPDAWREWAARRFRAGRIPNVSPTDFLQRYPGIGVLDLAETDLLVLGTDANQQREAHVIRLRACEAQRLFVGAFLIEHDGVTEWHPSLPKFRATRLRIADRLSFERSAYLLFAGLDGRPPDLVRLKGIRPICRLGTAIRPGVRGGPRNYQSHTMRVSARQLTNNTVSSLFNVYTRAMPGTDSATVSSQMFGDFCAALRPFYGLDEACLTSVIQGLLQRAAAGAAVASDDGASLCDESEFRPSSPGTLPSWHEGEWPSPVSSQMPCVEAWPDVCDLSL